MEERERPRQRQVTPTEGAPEGEGNDAILEQMGRLLETASAVVAGRLSRDSRSYLRAAAQHGGQ